MSFKKIISLLTLLIVLALPLTSVSALDFSSAPDLELGSTSPFVTSLQKVLNSNGFVINPVAGQPGSIGYESDYFGKLTQTALSKFQSAFGLSPSAGYFGAKTKAKVTELSGSMSSNTVATAQKGNLSAYGSDTCASISQFGITWTFDKAYTCGQFANGDWWVVNPSGSVKINNITPKATTRPSVTVKSNSYPASDMNGSMIGPAIPEGWDLVQGMDGFSIIEEAGSYSASLNIAKQLPYSVPQNRSVISSIGIAEPADVRTFIDTQAVLTVLASVPPEGSFRPTYFGTDKSIKWNKSQIDYSKLKKVVDMSPSTMEGSFSKPLVILGGADSNYKFENLIAKSNSPLFASAYVYGRDVSLGTAKGALALNSNATDAQKEKLAIGYIQAGLDIYGGVALGNTFDSNEGHTNGYKLPMTIAGVLLNDNNIKAKANGSLNIFSEDQQHLYVSQTDVSTPRTKTTSAGVTGCRNSTNPCDRPVEPYTSSMIGMPEWTGKGSNSEAGSQWGIIYRDVASPNLIGTALALQIMGIESIWNDPSFFDYVNQRSWPMYSSYYLGTEVQNYAPQPAVTVNGAVKNLVDDSIDSVWIKLVSPIGKIPSNYTGSKAVQSSWPKAQYPTSYPTYGTGTGGSVTPTPTTFTLTSTTAGTGSGSISGNTTTYTSGATATLTATPAAGSTFTGWSGACTGTGTCSIVMNANKTVTATFTATVTPTTFTLTTTKAGTGSGTINGAAATYTNGATATLTATPAAGSTFTGWSGACTGTGTCSIVMNANKTVTATFTAAIITPTTPFAVGNYVSVTSTNGINVRSAGSLTGTVLGTQALNAAGQIIGGSTTADGFTWWNINFNSGVDGWAAQENLLVTGTGSVTPSTFTLTSTTAGTGSGTISGNTTTYTSGATATLTATPAAGSTFTSWSGCTSTSGATCTVSMTSNKTVTATFTKTTVTPPTGSNSMLLSVNPNNKRYFQDATGKTVYLTGHHTWNNQLDTLNYTEYLNSYTSANLNFLSRMWRQENWFTEYGAAPFNKEGGKWNVLSFNQAYFDNLRSRVVQARAKGLYVGIMLAEGWWVHQEPEGWADSPYNGNNNVNWSASAVSLADMHTTKEPYLSAQKAYATKVLETLKDLDNVVYEVGNEMQKNSAPYATAMVTHVKNWEANSANGSLKHLVGVSSSGGATQVLASPGGISNSYMTGSNNADWISLGQREGWDLLDNPTLAPATKPNFADTDHSDPQLSSVVWPWKIFMRGHNPILMDEWNAPGSTINKLATTRRAMGQTKLMSDKINLVKMTPSNSSSDCSTSYCLRDTMNDEYLAYNSSVSAITVKVNGAGNYEYFIYSPANVNTSVSSGTFTATAGMSRTFNTVSGLSEGMIVHVKKSGTTPAPTTFTLTSTTAGTGSGTISGNTTTYTSGATATLTATPAAGSTFTSWSGCTSTSGATCTVTMNANKTVTANFTATVTPTTFTLTTTKAGTGSGTINGAAATYTNGATATLTATPAAGSTFTGWSGACTGTGTCSVVMNANKTVTATFTATVTPSTFTLTSTTAGTGSGTISGNTTTYTSGATATLTATPAAGSTFTSWSGCTSTSGATCTVSMTANKTVTATFTAAIITPTSPFAIGSYISVRSTPGTRVRSSASASATLLGSPVTGSTGQIIGGPVSADGYIWWNIDFTSGVDGWTIQDNITVTGTGSVTPSTFTLTSTTAGTGSGTISGNTTTYTSGATATLTATPAAGSTFTSWSGCTSTSGATCTVSMTANKTVTATFTKTTVTPPVVTPASKDDLLTISGPTSVALGKTYDVTLTYDAIDQRDIVVDLYLYGTYLAGGRTTVAAGKGQSATVKITVPTTSSLVGKKLNLFGYILPTGSNYGSHKDTIGQDNITVTAATASVSQPSNLSSGNAIYPDLELGITNPAVITLQKWLNSNGYVVNTQVGQPGSIGYESDYFGEKTKQALIKFQQAKGITPAAGYFGAKTRGVMGI